MVEVAEKYYQLLGEVLEQFKLLEGEKEKYKTELADLEYELAKSEGRVW